jgi:hypothetical protein
MDKEVSGRAAPLQDRHMWRQLLARLHPDAGGDHKLFLFACALKESLCEERRVRTAGREGTRPGAFLPYVAEYYDLLGIMQPGRLTKAWTTAPLPLSQSVGSKRSQRGRPPSNRP